MGDRGLFNFDDKKWLRSTTRKTVSESQVKHRHLRSVDLFAGCGGLALGVAEYCRRTKRKHVIEFASEWDIGVLEMFESNLQPRESSSADISTLFDGSLRTSRLTKTEERFLEAYPGALEPDILTGGPPCQGHSDLNNHTRRLDSRNDLYFRMVRAAFVLNPKTVIIENVSTVIHSNEQVVQLSKRKLESYGYKVAKAILAAEEFGVPQRRRRHFLVASRCAEPDFSILENLKFTDPRTARWAFHDLRDQLSQSEMMNATTNASPKNQKRMNWLVKNGQYTLPNRLRPDCHKDGHNYPAVYGRMYWDRPTDTITAGFTSNGQGRFTHPDTYPGRTITPREAARIQTFPDWFKFPTSKRTILKKAIGNAVPPILAMYVAHVVATTLEGEYEAFRGG